MNLTVTTLLLACGLILVVALFLRHLADFKRTYYSGVTWWSRWLPVCAIGAYISILGINLLPSLGARTFLRLSNYFSLPELIVFASITLLFFTRLGNLIASVSIIYALHRLLANAMITTENLGLYIFMGSLTIIAMLGDKLPWLAVGSPNFIAQRFREITVTLVTISAVGILCSALLDLAEFTRWVNSALGVRLSNGPICVLLISLLIGWITVALGYTRHLTLLFLCLPTICVLSFVSNWPSYCLIVPFVLCQSLSMAITDRREQLRRRNNNYTPQLSWSR